MARRNLDDLQAFVTVVREGSFTRAAAVMGVTPSALSQTIKALETRLQIRLLTRTTRSVSPTVAGERLSRAIGHRFEEIESELEAITALRDKPAGTVRITTTDDVVDTILLPKLMPLMQRYPDIRLEFDIDYGFRDIVADRFDAGVRLGESVDADMIAMPISHKTRMAAVASPEYFAGRPVPKTPADLTDHRCINIRLPTYGGLYVWEFERRGRALNVCVDAHMVFNTAPHIVTAALGGAGIAMLPEDAFTPYLQQGRLVRVLEDWCPPFPGYHLYYPSRRQHSPAFSLVVEALRL